MPAPSKPKKLPSKAKKPLSPPAKKSKGSGNLQIILAIVGVVVLLGVGITLFVLFGGDDKGKSIAQPAATVSRPAGNTGAGGGATDTGGDGAQAADLGPSLAKANELVDKMADSNQKEEAAKQLRDLIDSDAVTKARGMMQILNAIKDKALADPKLDGPAREFLLGLAKNKTNQALAAAALKVYEDNLKKGDEDLALDGSDEAIEPTNLLPNKVDVVFSLQMKKFLDSEYNRGVFSDGAFRKADFDRRVGIDALTIDQVVIGGMKDHNQAVGVIRTNTSIHWDDVRKALSMEANGVQIKGKTYYIGKIEFMNEFLIQRIPGLDALRKKAAFWRADAKTLVYGDEQSIKDLLENPPEKRSPLPPPSESVPGQSTAANNPPGGAAPPADGGPTGLSVSSSAGGGAGGGNDPSLSKGAGGQTSGEQKPKEDTTRFLTIDPKLRRLINYTEDNKNNSLLIFADMATSKVPVLVDYLFYLNRLPSSRGKEIEMIALTLPQVKGDPTLRLGLACRNRRETAGVANEVEKILNRIGKDELRDLFGFDFSVSGAVPPQASNQNRTPGFPGAPSGGFSPPGVGSSNPGGVPPDDAVGASGGAGNAPPPPQTGQSSGGGAGGGGAGIGKGTGRDSGANMNLGANNPQQGQTTGSEAEAPGGRFNIERIEEYILITTSVKSSLSDFTDKQVSTWMAQLRGNQELSTGRLRFGDLAAGMEYYKSDLARQNKPLLFPYGAFPRTLDPDRGPRPYPPAERVSFLRETLPYLGDERYYNLFGKIEIEKSWRDPTNVKIGSILVPHFLNPAAGISPYTKVKNIEQPMAATHFVGMAGVGPDAANYPKSDPRAGMFGYNRQTSPDDVKDGLANTIYMIEVDKALIGPWIAGGGATVRGTSMTGNDVGRRGGFSSPNYGGKAGVWVLMGDGSTRFLTKDVPPEVFKALCTMAGSDSAGAIDLVATKHDLEVTPRTEAQAAATSTKKKRVVEEEEAPVKK